MNEPMIKIRRQKRRTMMMRALPGVVEVYIPHWMTKSDRRVQRFIRQGLQNLGDDLPTVPDEKTSRDQILALVDTYAARIGVTPARVQLRKMVRKWGSCSQKGTVTLNDRLRWLPVHLVEYVVVHELVHLKELNHSPQFWSLLGNYLPDYASRLDELRQEEKQLW